MVVLATRGAVNASTGMVDDAGVDVTFFNRTGSIDVQIKGRTLDAKTSMDSKFVANVRSATFQPREDLSFLFVIANFDSMELGPFWLVPSMEFEKRANVPKQGEILRITASLKTGTRDKWSEFQFVRKDLAMKISQLGSAVGQMPFRRIDRSGGAAQLLEVHPALRPDRGADAGGDFPSGRCWCSGWRESKTGRSDRGRFAWRKSSGMWFGMASRRWEWDSQVSRHRVRGSVCRGAAGDRSCRVSFIWRRLAAGVGRVNGR